MNKQSEHFLFGNETEIEEKDCAHDLIRKMRTGIGE